MAAANTTASWCERADFSHSHSCPARVLVLGAAMNHPITRRTAIKTGAALAAAGTLPFEAAAQEPKRPIVEGYTDQLSYAPGDEVKLHVSCSRPVALGVTRTGKPFSPVGPSRGFSPGEHSIPKDASSHGCHWPVSK